MGPFNITGSQDQSQDAQSQSQSPSIGGTVSGGLDWLAGAISPQYKQTQVMAQGMDSISKIMQTNGGDQARAMLQFAQTPEAHAIMRVPGAFPKFIEQFQQAAKEPDLQSAQVGQGNGGIVTRGAQTMMTQQQNPQGITTPPGNNTQFFQGGKPVGSQSTPTTQTQDFTQMADKYGQFLKPDQLAQMAMMNQAKSDISQRMVFGQGLLNSGVPKDIVDQVVTGRMVVTQDAKIPGRFYLQDTWQPGTIQAIQTGPKPQDSINPSYNGAGKDPASFHSSPQSSNIAPANPQTPATQAIAAKYKVPVEAIKSDGTIDPVKAYGPTSIMVLGAGLPALAQNNAGIIGRWFDPRNQDESSEVVSQAEIVMQSLQTLAAMPASGTRVKLMAENLMEMGPEHEKMNDPIYATDQLIQMRNTFEQVSKVNQREITNSLQEGIPADNSNISDMKKQNAAFEAVLGFLPSSDSLMSMRQAIKDGKIANVPSVTSAGSTIGKVAGSAISHGAQALFGSSSVDEFNSNPSAAIDKVSKASKQDLMGMAKTYGKLDPSIQRAFDARVQELRGKPQGATQAPMDKRPGSNISNFAPDNGKKQGPSVQQFTQNPDAAPKTQQGQSPFASHSPNSRVQNAFSGLGQ